MLPDTQKMSMKLAIESKISCSATSVTSFGMLAVRPTGAHVPTTATATVLVRPYSLRLPTVPVTSAAGTEARMRRASSS